MLAPALCYYILFFAGPVIVLMMFSVFTFRNLLWVPKLTLDNYYMALTDPVFAKILVRTFYLASWVTLLTLLVAYPFTFIITFVLPSRREFFYFLVLLTRGESTVISNKNFGLFLYFRKLGLCELW